MENLIRRVLYLKDEHNVTWEELFLFLSLIVAIIALCK